MTAPSLVRTELGSPRRPAAASASDSGCLSEAIPGSVQGPCRGCHSPTFQARVGVVCIPARSSSAEETPGDRFPTLTHHGPAREGDCRHRANVEKGSESLCGLHSPPILSPRRRQSGLLKHLILFFCVLVLNKTFFFLIKVCCQVTPLHKTIPWFSTVVRIICELLTKAHKALVPAYLSQSHQVLLCPSFISLSHTGQARSHLRVFARACFFLCLEST